MRNLTLKKILYLSFPAVALAFFASLLLLSYSHSNKFAQERDEQTESKTAETLPTPAVKNASFSAVPLVSDKIVTQKAVATKTTTTVITTKGDELTVLINKTIGLPSTYVPTDLTSLVGLVATEKNELLRKPASDKLIEMFAAAKADGYELSVTSAYRSYATQIATFNRWAALLGRTAAARVSALPGHSQHQLGTALDLSATRIKENLTTDFGQTPEGLWLAENSWKFGYALSYPAGKESITGYSYEPWHFRYIGVSPAAQMHNLGWDLETYLQKYGVW